MQKEDAIVTHARRKLGEVRIRLQPHKAAVVVVAANAEVAPALDVERRQVQPMRLPAVEHVASQLGETIL